MSDITKISILQNGEQETVDLTTNKVVTGSVVVGGVGGTELTKTVLDNLIASEGATTQVVDKFMLTGTNETNKFVTLSKTPSVAASTILLVDGAPNLTYGLDYTVSGNQLSWNTLGLDGLLNSGDNLTVTYPT